MVGHPVQQGLLRPEVTKRWGRRGCDLAGTSQVETRAKGTKKESNIRGSLGPGDLGES